MLELATGQQQLSGETYLCSTQLLYVNLQLPFISAMESLAFSHKNSSANDRST